MTKIRRKIPYLAAFITTLSLTLFGCGGGGGSSTVDDATPAIGTAYYVDSAVSGIDYVCGAQEGVTGENGEFTFEVGQSCTFYLGAVPLRDIVADELQDGGTVQETDVAVARILQTFDEDGDPSNGITISSATVEALATAGITSLPDTEEEYTAMVEAVGDVATVVSTADAETHLLSSILAGKTFLDVGYDANGPVYNSLTFSEDLTTVNWTNQLDTESGSAALSYEEGVLTVTGDGEEPFTLELTLVESNDSYYIQMLAADGHIERMYPNAEQAESYLFESTLTGHTVYLVDTGRLLIETWVVNDDLTSISWSQEYDSGTTSYVSYADGVLTAADDETAVFTLTEITSDYLVLSYQVEGIGSGVSYLYRDLSLAEAYLQTLQANNNSGDTLAFTEEMISGQSLYDSEFYRLDFSSDSNTFTSTSLTNLEEEDGSVSIAYEIVDGKLEIADEQLTVTLVGQGDGYYEVELTDNQYGITEASTLYTSQSAFNSALYTDLSSTVTVVDSSEDSNDTSHAGFELLTLSAVESGSDLVITATANGNILDAMATSVTTGFEHNMWIELNDSLEFGFADASRVWCDENTWEAGVFTGGTPVPTSEYSYSISGNTVTFTISADRIPQNAGNYLRIVAEIGEDAISSLDEGDDQKIYDSVQLGALWSYSGSTTDPSATNAPTGAWVYSEPGAPFAGLAVILDDQNYFGAQQTLGEEGIIGGVEAGTYTLVDGVFTDAVPTVNSNAGDTLVCDEIADNGDGTATISIYDCYTGTLQEEGLLTQIVSTNESPEAGAWINTEGNINGDGETAIMLVLDGNGNYMEADLNVNYPDFYSVNGIIQNATEFGTYVVNGDGTVSVTPAAVTDTSAVCTSSDTSGCGTIAGDSNAAAGFSDLANTTVEVAIVNDVLTLTVEGTQISFQRVQ